MMHKVSTNLLDRHKVDISPSYLCRTSYVCKGLCL